VLPAGAQLPPEEEAVALPPGGVYAEDGGTMLAFGSRPNGVNVCATGTGAACDIQQVDPWVSIGSLGAAFADFQVDTAGTVAKPRGFGVDTGITVSGATHGANGWVAVGNVAFWDSLLYHNTTRRGLIWQSLDGQTWQRIDVRDIVGDTSVVLSAVEATPNGYVAIGGIAQPNLFDGPSRGLVLTSPDGVTWSKAAELPRQWAVATRQVLVGIKRIVVTGVEYVCDASAGAMNDFSVGAQFRAWASDDNGASFHEVGLAGNGAVEDPLPPPSDPAACPDMFSQDAAYRSSAGLVTLDGDRLYLVSADGATIAASDDLSTWRTVTVPDALATPGAGGDPPQPGSVEDLYRDDEGLVLLEFQVLRRSDGSQVSFGSQMYSWRSTDNGATWQLQPLAEPTPLALSALGGMRRFSDGRRAFFGTRGDEIVVRFVKAGDLQPWGTCHPAPNAKCRFVAIDGLSAAGADLSGVDFTGATLTNADLAGANLTGANLTGASLPGSVLLAKLDGVLLENATLHLEANGQYANGSLAGVSLSNVSFYGHGGAAANLQGTDFSGATLKNTVFSSIDLTGSNFATAIFDPNHGVIFLGDVTCPDGAPPTDGSFDHESCRI
jgi:hypothetical protein